ncbi:MAG: TetR/AcrR family transcriptional regulator [Anaerolineae bacterium]|jgi:AcrR family transcriptional regulator|nr:TetR/AcrR family transcriptional regulator [Anaerolineae bacterium]
MSHKIDRRVLRTRQLLRGALLSLVQERGFEALTVQDITERANLNRATFYLHYADKHDLLMQVIRETLAELTDLPLPAANAGDRTGMDAELRGFFERVFAHTLSHLDFYRVMFGVGSGVGLSEELHHTIYRVAFWLIERSPVQGWRMPPEVVISVLSGAFLGMVRWAVAQPSAPDPALMAAQFTALTMPGLLDAILSE